jgi:TPR repeat protein
LLGAGVPQDIPQAIQIRTKACDAGDMELCWRLGDLFEDGVEPSFTSDKMKDPAKAAVFKKKACALGYKAAECSKL